GPRPAVELGAQSLAQLGVDRSAARAASYFVVHALGETTPSPRRRLTFDRSGAPVFHLHWTGEDRLRARDMRETVAAAARALAPRARIIPVEDPLRAGGIAHEAGTARM